MKKRGEARLTPMVVDGLRTRKAARLAVYADITIRMKNDQPVHAIRCAALPPSSGNPIVVRCIMLLPCNGTSQ